MFCYANIKNYWNINIHFSFLFFISVFLLIHIEDSQAQELSQKNSNNYIQSENNNKITITASGSGNAVSTKNAPASIITLEEEDLKARPLQNLTQALNATEGISIINSNTNENDISIRGLGGEYTLILVDGKRLNTREARGRGGSGFEHGWLPAPETIERIEVIKGSMSTLYGSDAMGGVINIITKKTASKWQGTVSAQSTLQENRNTRDIHQTDLYLRGPLKKKQLDLHLFGMLSHRDEDNLPGGFQGQNMQNIGSKLIWSPTKNQSLTIEAGQQVQTRISTDITRNRSLGEFKYPRTYQSITYNGEFDKTRLSFYTQNEVSQSGISNSQTKITPEIQNIVAEGKVSSSLFSRQLITVGGQINSASLTDSIIAPESQPGNSSYQKMTPHFLQHALFVEDEIFITDQINLTLGLRQDWHENYGHHLNPRIYSVYEVTPSLTLKGGVASGFKTPNIRAITPNYTMPTGGPGGTGIIYGNPDLKPENSLTSEFGVLYEFKKKASLAFTTFITQFNNKIINYNTGDLDDNGFTIWKNMNADEATIQGFELALKTKVSETLNISLNYTYTDSQQKTSQSETLQLNGQPLTSTPKHASHLKAETRLSSHLGSYALVSYQGDRIAASTRGGIMNRKAYITTELGGSYRFNAKTDMQFAILNLENKNLNFVEDGYIIDGRRYWMNLRHHF